VVEAGPPSQVIDNPQQAATQAFLGTFQCLDCGYTELRSM
jgi:predicted nucleic-acid-binding Zn-ribbon protein